MVKNDLKRSVIHPILHSGYHLLQRTRFRRPLASDGHGQVRNEFVQADLE